MDAVMVFWRGKGSKGCPCIRLMNSFSRARAGLPEKARVKRLGLVFWFSNISLYSCDVPLSAQVRNAVPI